MSGAESEVARILQLEMLNQVQSAEAYHDFTKSTKKVLETLKKLSDEGPAESV